MDQVLDETYQYLADIHKMTKEQVVIVNADIDMFKQITSNKYSDIQREIEEEKKRRLININEYYQKAKKMITEMLDKKETLEAVIHSIQLYGQHLSNVSEYDLTSSILLILLKSEEMCKSVPEPRLNGFLTWSEWYVKGEVHEVRVEWVGEVNVESDQQLTTVAGQSVTRGDRGVRKLNTFTTQCNGDVTGMVSYHNYIFIVHDNNEKLFVYDERGRLRKYVLIYCKKNNVIMGNPKGLCLVRCHGGRHSLVINDCPGQCLWWLTTEKQTGDVKLGQPQRHTFHYYPHGMSSDRSGRAVVANFCTKCVYVYSHPGHYVICIQLSINVRPWYVLADRSDGYVVKQGPVELIWVNSAGQVTRRYTDQPDVRPEHITSDGTDLLVSDLDNHCVHIVTREGRHDGHLITDIDPTCVCLNPAGHRLWVAYKGKDDMMRVMEMSYTAQSSAVTSPVTSTTLKTSALSLYTTIGNMGLYFYLLFISFILYLMYMFVCVVYF